MTLAKTTTLRIIAMIAALAVVGIVGMWGLVGLNHNLAAALDQYNQLRRVYNAGLDIATARDALQADPPNTARGMERIALALQHIEQLPDQPQEDVLCRNLCNQLKDALAMLQNDPSPRNIAEARGRINRAMGNLGQLVSATTNNITQINDNSKHRLHSTLWIVGSLTFLFVVLASAIGIWQYRGVIGPLGRLQRGARRLAAGRFDQRLPTTGPTELAALSEQFNHMADELQTLYRDLEDKVRTTSKELARSERLASVGYLAAGVAHEINNPLGIIATHAELTLDMLKRHREKVTSEEVEQTLRVICDEAFRCKSITEKLLGLSRREPTQPQPISLKTLAGQVAQMVGALPAHRHIPLELNFSDDCVVQASEGEMTQVLLNLTTNAMQHVDDSTGRVTLSGKTGEQWVAVDVRDNGCGMDEQMLGRVFEPFYTRRKSSPDKPSAPGTGLGLSIVHAIITNHGGRITAESEGPGKGSCFTIELPIANT